MSEKNLPCSVIQDLLPLYQDDVCTEETAGLVSRHLEGCEECAGIHSAMKTALEPLESTNAENAILSVRKTYRTIRVRTLLIAILAAILVYAGCTTLFHSLKQPTVALSAQEMDATTLYLDADNKVYIHLATDQYVIHHSIGRSTRYNTQTRTLYINMYRPSWPYAIKIDNTRPIPQNPETMRMDATIYDLWQAEIIDGQMIAYPGNDEHKGMEVETIMIGNDKDGYEVLWETGDAIAQLPLGRAVFVAPEQEVP